MCVKTRKHKETERATGVRSPTTARRQDNVRSGRRFRSHGRNGRQICARTPAIRARSKCEIPTGTSRYRTVTDKSRYSPLWFGKMGRATVQRGQQFEVSGPTRLSSERERVGLLVPRPRLVLRPPSLGQTCAGANACLPTD